MKTSRKRLTLSISLILLATSGCAAGSIVPQLGLTPKFVMGDYCRIAKPITYDSKTDSLATIKQIEYHNSQYVCVCEGDCPEKK